MAKKHKFDIKPVGEAELGQVDREILGKTVDDGVHPLSMAKEIRLDRIKPDPTQPRTDFDPERLEELAASIEEQGILNPISVQYVRDEDYFMIIHGERRWKAAKMVGLKAIPAIIKTVDEGQRLVQQLIENIQREDLNPVDRGEALRRLREELRLTSWKAVGEKIGVSRVRVHQLLATTEYPEEIQEDLRSGAISEKEARVYTSLPTHHQLALHRAWKDEELSGEQAQQVARFLKDQPQQDLEEAIKALFSEGQSVEESSSRREGKRKPSFTAQSVIKFNDRLQKALPGFELGNLSSDDRDRLGDSLRNLHSLIEELLERLET